MGPTWLGSACALEDGGGVGEDGVQPRLRLLQQGGDPQQARILRRELRRSRLQRRLRTLLRRHCARARQGGGRGSVRKARPG